ncbi:MAG: hypothetical protein WDW38_002637 [Sanguina aurantia]
MLQHSSSTCRARACHALALHGGHVAEARPPSRRAWRLAMFARVSSPLIHIICRPVSQQRSRSQVSSTTFHSEGGPAPSASDRHNTGTLSEYLPGNGYSDLRVTEGGPGPHQSCNKALQSADGHQPADQGLLIPAPESQDPAQTTVPPAAVSLAVLVPARREHHPRCSENLTDLVHFITEEHLSFDCVNTSFGLRTIAHKRHATLQALRANDPASLDLEELWYSQNVLPAVLLLNKRALTLIKEFEPQDLATTLWAHGTLGYKDDHLFQLLCEACLEQSTFRHMKPVDVANIMTAFTRLRHHHKELVQRSLQVILNQLHECKAEEFTQILHGLARIGYHPGDRFITAMAEGMMYKLGEFGTQLGITARRSGESADSSQQQGADPKLGQVHGCERAAVGREAAACSILWCGADERAPVPSERSRVHIGPLWCDACSAFESMTFPASEITIFDTPPKTQRGWSTGGCAHGSTHREHPLAAQLPKSAPAHPRLHCPDCQTVGDGASAQLPTSPDPLPTRQSQQACLILLPGHGGHRSPAESTPGSPDEQWLEDCAPRRVLELFSTKWTSMILHALHVQHQGEARAGVLLRSLPGISRKMLTQTLRELESSGLVDRRVQDTVPPGVDYSLTPLGTLMVEPIELIYDWARTNSGSLDQLQARRTSKRR